MIGASNAENPLLDLIEYIRDLHTALHVMLENSKNATAQNVERKPG